MPTISELIEVARAERDMADNPHDRASWAKIMLFLLGMQAGSGRA